MPRPLSNKPQKNIYIDPVLQRAYLKARAEAAEKGEDFPPTLREFVEMAARYYLEKVSPESLIPTPGRPPTRTPRKK